MTEQEWSECNNVEVKLSGLGGKATERKVRLFAAACCRVVWHLMTDGWCKEAVELAERFADGHSTEQERKHAHAIGMELIGDGDPPNEPLAAALSTLESANPKYDGLTPLFAGAFATAAAAAYAFANAESMFRGESPQGSPAWHTDLAKAEHVQLTLLGDIFGPLPFYATTLSSPLLAWQEGTIPKLAQAIYDDRAFDRMSVLADALEKAGCTNADILTHCRGKGPHVRGCWVVDLLLGKE